MTELTPIPQPDADPILGNIRDLDGSAPIQSLMRLARVHGPIFQLKLPGGRAVFVSSVELMAELADESRFDKRVHQVLRNIRDFAGDGLFTAYTNEPNWERAHRILMPAFGPLSIRKMFPQMWDIAEQMLLRWERYGEDTVIDVSADMTRLTLDTIALCAFDYRFNSFYQTELHPFVGAMVGALAEAGARARRPPLANQLMLLARREYDADIGLLHDVSDQVIAERRQDPTDDHPDDLLNRMMTGRDPITGETLSDENIRNQMVTFLIAGHETTSGLLSFAFYHLLRHPEALQRARDEVDAVIGDDVPDVHHLPDLVYVDQILKETLRIWPTAPAIGVRPYEDTVIGGRYELSSDDTVMVVLPSLHRDPAVWGDDVEAFRPERFAPDAIDDIPEHAWKPFGNGQRACIGRPFAMQEAQLVVASVLQRFDLVPADPEYGLRIKETLTLKPEGFRVRVKLRSGRGFRTQRPGGAGATPVLAPTRVREVTETAARANGGAGQAGGEPLLVLFGSETGSSEAFAQQIASDAAAKGYDAEVGPLDEHSGPLPTDGAVVVVTASYEGKPPINARQFVAWAESLQPGDLDGVRFTVFGCGNRDWHKTYQAVPIRIDKLLVGAGAQRIKERGEADAAGDFFGDFDRWYATLWDDVAAALGTEVSTSTAGGLEVELVRGRRSSILRHADLQLGEVEENRELVDVSSPLGRSKRHLVIRMPEAMRYRTGDYLAVLPSNPEANIERALRRFGFSADDQVVIRNDNGAVTTLPTDHPVHVGEVLANYVELGQPATRRQLEMLLATTDCPPEKAALDALLDHYEEEVLAKRMSVLDVLEHNESCDVPFARFLEMVPPMRARQYSISSSPLVDADRCSLTVAVVNEPAWSGRGRYLGVASNFLAEAEAGDRFPVAVRPSNVAFHPPESPEVPIVMVCAGSGIAPFHGFLEERALQKANGQPVGPALLFFGCTHPDVDFLYREELARWEADDVVSVRPAFSQAPTDPGGEITYVQDRLWHDRAEVETLFRQGARIYVCGDGRFMAPAVRETFVRMYAEAAGVTEAEAAEWADELERTSTRYAADVFS